MLYDISKTFHENIKAGVSYDGEMPLRLLDEPTYRLFDYAVCSPVGIAACPFTATAHGVTLASKLGFDIITWKTIRSKPSEPHLWPNLTYVQLEHEYAVATDKKTNSLANSIGNASYALEPTLIEIKKGLDSLQTGQIVMSSIYGVGNTHQEIIDDFVYLAQRVQEVGVHAIELNCSCPNVAGAYFQDIDFMNALIKKVTQAVSVPVTIKVGVAHKDQLSALMKVCAHAGARGISGINSMSMPVRTQKGDAYFGNNRLYAGVSGDAIRERALQWVRDAAEINQQEKLDLTLLGGGGIMQSDHIDHLLNVGAHAAMIATGALVDPLIAMNYHKASYVNKDDNFVPRSDHAY